MLLTPTFLWPIQPMSQWSPWHRASHSPWQSVHRPLRRRTTPRKLAEEPDNKKPSLLLPYLCRFLEISPRLNFFPPFVTFYVAERGWNQKGAVTSCNRGGCCRVNKCQEREPSWPFLWEGLTVRKRNFWALTLNAEGILFSLPSATGGRAIHLFEMFGFYFHHLYIF